ncbi:hypothetical protein [Thermocoleostomius sinensis]|uniref:Uncharacterized protein n=1 Tax=Thermocoleostomius sinensis A174 TaxID=2016057 RepID=A0A9E9C7Y5_9CYAN|nr:hypothetical protein [Thermocoleostomius sinensis]WAL59733.1 hypothetical protein OXH18_21565 [Thermocoleostomius sinensis A174]
MNKLQERFDEGWSVQIYDGNRHLRCSLSASHMRVFLAGLVVGFILALVGLSHSPRAQSSQVSPSFSPPIESPLSLN